MLVPVNRFLTKTSRRCRPCWKEMLAPVNRFLTKTSRRCRPCWKEMLAPVNRFLTKTSRRCRPCWKEMLAPVNPFLMKTNQRSYLPCISVVCQCLTAAQFTQTTTENVSLGVGMYISFVGFRMTLLSSYLSRKASASRAEDPGFESRSRRDFFGVKSYQ